MYTCVYCEQPTDWDEWIEVHDGCFFRGYAHLECAVDEAGSWTSEWGDAEWEMKHQQEGRYANDQDNAA